MNQYFLIIFIIQWFGFNVDEWRDYFGITVTKGETLEVKQCRYGHAIWIGEVIIWPNFGGHGRRKFDWADRQWGAHDRVVKPSEGCSVVPDDQGSLPSEQPKEDDNKNISTANYTNTNRTKTVWDNAAPPSIGSSIVLSDLNAERYQKWAKLPQVRINSFKVCNIVYGIIILSCFLFPLFVIAFFSSDGTI